MRLWLALAACFFTALAHAETLTAQQILEKNYLANRFTDSTANIRMVLRNKEGKERVRQLKSYSKLQDNAADAMYALFFLSPADIKGTGTLLIQRQQAEDDMWIYLPAARKTRRLLSDNKRDSFMGSDLSYGDIIGHRPTDWTATLVREDQFNGVPVYVLEATPRSPAVASSTGYSKRVLTIDKSNFIALKIDYWDDKKSPLKTITVSDIQQRGKVGQYQFMKLEADQLKTGNHTTLAYESFEVGTGLDDALFSQRTLERGVE